ncbi:uncharacterized protein LOC105285333 [Ooceraea biroi]|uniref:uncharacterized protein LOC105285333 n=1 Tax=Ooceraea biroi TaxID=2015173 RepID=UPI0005B97AF9|nr:uncharacterized protein LOC105285333 [Ooceraea biroi]
MYGYVLPCELTRKEKRTRYDYCTHIINKCEIDPSFLDRLIIGCELSISTPEMTSSTPGTSRQDEQVAVLQTACCFYDSTGLMYRECHTTTAKEEDAGTSPERLSIVWNSIIESRPDYEGEKPKQTPRFYLLLDRSYDIIDVRRLHPTTSLSRNPGFIPHLLIMCGNNRSVPGFLLWLASVARHGHTFQFY